MDVLEVAALRSKRQREVAYKGAAMLELGFYPKNEFSQLSFLISAMVYGKKKKRIRAANMLMTISRMLKNGDTLSLTLFDIAKTKNRYERYHLSEYAIYD